MIVYALKKLSRWSLAAIRGRSGTLKRTILFALLLSLHSSATVTATTESCTSTSCRRYLEEKKHVDTDTDTEGSVLDSNGHPVEESEEYNDHDEDDMTPEEWADYQKMHPRSSGMNVTIDDSHSSGESPSPDPGSLQNVNPEFGKQGSSMVSIGDRSPDQQGLSPPSSQQSPSPSPGQSPSPSPGQSPSPSPGQSPSPTPGANARPPPPVPFPPPAPGGPNPPSPPPSNPLNLFNPSPPPPPPFDLKSLYWREKSYIKQPCDKLDPPRDLKEWGRWSDPAMWPSGSFSGKDLDVNIPCGMFMLFDVPASKGGVILRSLNITGYLRFVDDNSVGPVSLSAQYIIVQGVLEIGQPDAHFMHKAIITLLPVPSRATMKGMEDVGHQVLAVAGGQVKMFGMPGGEATPSWVRLNGTALAGDKSINVTGDVSKWPRGGKIVVATTDFDFEQSEEMVIAAVKCTSGADCVIELGQPLKYMHWGTEVPTGVPGVGMLQAAEVILLTRNIVVTAPDHRDSDRIGGHMIVYMTQAPQSIFGVELYYMGQQGNIGRYPLHIHLCGNIPNTFIKKCSIHNTNQRCYVMHASHNITFSDNVAWEGVGHCFMLEDGVERSNNLSRNVGITSRPPKKFLYLVINGKKTKETDEQSTIFWMSSTTNYVENNVAVGATFGFWYEMRKEVRGASATMVGASKVIPDAQDFFGDFHGNVAHGNVVGVSFYKNGYRAPNGVVLRNITAYKNIESGIRIHGSHNIILENTIVSDSRLGVDFAWKGNETLRNSIIMSYTANFGNPVNCSHSKSVHACVPLNVSCSRDFNFSTVTDFPGAGWRTVPRDVLNWHKTSGQLGVNLADDNTVENTTFVNFDNGQCYEGGAFGWGNFQGIYFSAVTRLDRITFINTTINRYWDDPSRDVKSDAWVIMYDKLGSITGKMESYIVPENLPSLQLPGGCPAYSDRWHARVCPNTCMRTIQIIYDEPGNFPARGPIKVPVSTLKLVRTQDGVAMNRHSEFGRGPMMSNVNGKPTLRRRWFLTVFANYTYRVELPGLAKGAKMPDIHFRYVDVDLVRGANCQGEVLLQPNGSTNFVQPTREVM